MADCHGAPVAQQAPVGTPTVALVGAPNAGKSTLFNALTGASATMGNYPGTTVEVSRGVWRAPGATYNIIDFPGAYSLDPVSPDEALTRELLIDDSRDHPDLILVAVDTSNLARGLYLVAQLAEHPSSCAGGNCNSCIAAAANGMTCADRPRKGPVALVLQKRPG